MIKLRVLRFLLVLAAWLSVGCGYHLRADGEPVGIGLENLAIPLFTSTSSDLGFEAAFTRIIREEFISHAKVPLVPEERAQVILIGRIYEIRTDPLGYDSKTFTVGDGSGTYSVTNSRRLRIKLDVQMVDQARGKVLWHDKVMEERTSYQVESDPLATQFYQQQAVEKLARRVAKKIYQRTVERF